MSVTPRKKSSSRTKALKQVGALCVCQADESDQLLILLVTSRDTGRWVIPKGWPARRLKALEAAAREALEEAGVLGKVSAKPVGQYRYTRLFKNGDRAHVVSVYILAVRTVLATWLEMPERQRRWFSLPSAARRVAEPELKTLIRRAGQVNVHPKWRKLSELKSEDGRGVKGRAAKKLKIRKQLISSKGK